MRNSIDDVMTAMIVKPSKYFASTQSTTRGTFRSGLNGPWKSRPGKKPLIVSAASVTFGLTTRHGKDTWRISTIRRYHWSTLMCQTLMRVKLMRIL